MDPPLPTRLRRGDVVAVTLPPGEAWPSILSECWESEAALLPVDDRLPGPAREALLSAGAPTVLVSKEGWSRLPTGRAADPAVALIIATSGSSRHQRLVELSRPAVAAAVTASLQALRAEPGDGWVSCLPLAHIGGLLVVLRGLLGGAPLRFRSPRDLAPTAGDRFVSVVPTQLVRALGAGIDLRGYRAMVVGGGGMAAGLGERAAAAGVRAIATYGLTQSCGGVVYDGLPLPGVSVRVDAGGEIELGGPTLLRGYRDGSPAGLTGDGWLRTGDAGRIGEGGRLQVRGRLDDVIVTGGEKVWPTDIEEVLRSHPEVRDCAVYGRPDPDWGERVVAVVVPRDPRIPPGLEELRQWAGAALGRHLAPREVVVVSALPRTALGKVRRGELRRRAGEAQAP
ncbi:MAG TPA: AMP-binding protein [Candidatus Binatia bacterium]|nr:AMP-binding protein [Candidatus Binatia bacterium]